MKKIAILGGKENFIDFFNRVLEAMNIYCKIITDMDVNISDHYEYVILQGSGEYCKLKLNSGYYFINMDNCCLKDSNIYGNIITYGLGNKNTVTVSSIDSTSESFVYCLQRYLNHNALAMLQPEEIPVIIDFENDDELYAAMVGITIAFLERGSIAETKLELINKK